MELKVVYLSDVPDDPHREGLKLIEMWAIRGIRFSEGLSQMGETLLTTLILLIVLANNLGNESFRISAEVKDVVGKVKLG